MRSHFRILSPVVRMAAIFSLLAVIAAPQLHAADKYSQTRAALVAQAGATDVNDPLEDVNRAIFEFNDFFYALLLRPLGEMYRTFLPDIVQDGIHNALKNLNSPVILANDLLQGEFDRAWVTTQRAVINSTVGVGGLYDAADKFWEIKGHKEDFGQTLAVWGVGEGFYLVLPIFGPSNPRDAVGLLVNAYMDPFSRYLNNIHEEDAAMARFVVAGVDEFANVMDDLEKLKNTSVDYYAAVRSISRQKRAVDIRNGTQTEGAPLPDLQYDLNAELAN